MLAELSDPAFRFLLVFAVYGRSQIVAQLGDYLIGLACRELDLRKNQAGVREYIFTLTEHFNGFHSGAALGNQSAAQHIACGRGLGIQVQSLARFGFRFLISIQ